MPRLGCDTRIEKPTMSLVDRVSDLRKRVTWLKNVEYCLLGDQNERLNKIKVERDEVETLNRNLRKRLIISPHETNSLHQSQKTYYQTVDTHNQLLSVHRAVLNRFRQLCDHVNEKSGFNHHREIQDNQTITRRIRELQERLISVKLLHRTLQNCKQYLQCDLDLLRKELPNVQREIGQKLIQRSILKKEFQEIVSENKTRLQAYQQLLDQTETQTRQRRTIHEQAMNAVAEQLEDQYQVQMMAINEMTAALEARRLTSTAVPVLTTEPKGQTLMTVDEVTQVRYMYDQFYKIIMAGFPIDITNSDQLKTMIHEVSSRTVALISMTKRMMEEKEQLNRQRNRMDKLRQLIDMSMDLKTETSNRMLNEMTEQQHKFESFFLNDIVEEQNRILRQINDFLLVLSKILCEHIDSNSISEPPSDFIERLHHIFDLVLKTMKATAIESMDEEDRQISSSLRRSGGDEQGHSVSKNSQSHMTDRSINSSLSSLISRPKRTSVKNQLY